MDSLTNQELLSMVEENPSWLQEWLDEDMTDMWDDGLNIVSIDVVSPVHSYLCNIFYVFEYWS